MSVSRVFVKFVYLTAEFAINTLLAPADRRQPAAVSPHA